MEQPVKAFRHNDSYENFLETLRVREGKKIKLGTDFVSDVKNKPYGKKEGEDLLVDGKEKLIDLQDRLYAHDSHSVLIVLQGIDAAGKDSAIKHVMSGLNPTGIKVASFKAPSKNELDHDFFWRHNLQLPRRGEIGIFNRSHYENVLVTRVHPHLILNENLPHIEKVEDITHDFWLNRFEQINRWEKNLHDNGTTIIKFFLLLSKDEQKQRFLKRIDNPEKNWKFDANDVRERQFWDEYIAAFEEMLPATSTAYAPWYVLPADDKWFARLSMMHIIYKEFLKLNLEYPKISPQEVDQLQEIKGQLLAEVK